MGGEESLVAQRLGEMTQELRDVRGSVSDLSKSIGNMATRNDLERQQQQTERDLSLVEQRMEQKIEGVKSELHTAVGAVDTRVTTLTDTIAKSDADLKIEESKRKTQLYILGGGAIVALIGGLSGLATAIVNTTLGAP